MAVYKKLFAMDDLCGIGGCMEIGDFTKRV